MCGHKAGKCDYTCESIKKGKYGVDPFFCGCAYDVITQAAAIRLDSPPARYEYMGGTFCSLAPPTTALAEPVATGGKASTAGATDAGTTGDSYSCLPASGHAHGSCHTSVSASAMHISSRSLAPPTTTLAEPIAPEPPPLILAPALHPRHPRLWHTPQRLRPVQFRVRP
jgi:hypothetical protein